MSEDNRTDTHRGEGAPQIDQFVLYAERSIKLGHDCHAFEGDMGIRTAAGTEGRDRRHATHRREAYALPQLVFALDSA